MDALIEKILQQVKSGELSETEAEKQYHELVSTQEIIEQLSSYDAENLPVIDLKAEQQTVNDNKIIYTDRTVECIKKVENPEYRLFVFLPFGFGNETVSWSWKNSFEDQKNVEIWLMGASDISDWQQLVKYLIEQMLPFCDIPFIVYGHSMGGIVAYETLVELEHQYQLSPIVFIPSSVAPPGIFQRIKVLPPIYDIDDEMDMSDCRNLLEKSQIILPVKSGVKPMTDEAMRCDIALLKTYQHEGKTLSCTVMALQANNDILVKDAVTVSLWKDYTKGSFLFQEVEGTHLYFINPPKSFFDLIKSFLQKNERLTQRLFEPKTYRLLSFETGTEEVNVYPYGINPKGYLIYQSDGKMAAHLWNSSRKKKDLTDCSAIELAAEQMLTYLSYSGDYRVRQRVIEHSVQVSTDPNFVNDNLIRYFYIENNQITLLTAPLTTRELKQSKSSTYCKLVWEELKGDMKYDNHPLIGTWYLQSYQDHDKEQLEANPEGVLILTAQGYFSMIGMQLLRNRPCYDNLILATDQEINDAMETSISYCGQFEFTNENNITFIIEEGSLGLVGQQKTMQYQLSGHQLILRSEDKNSQDDTQHSMIEIWKRN